MDNKYECKDGVCYLRKNIIITDQQKNVPLPKLDDEWTIYGAKWCNFCNKAREQLEELDKTYLYHDVDIYRNVKDILKKLTRNQQTIPIIFNKTTFIGGYTELCKFLEKK